MGVSVRGGWMVGGSSLRVVFMVWVYRTGPSEKSACALLGRGVMLKCYQMWTWTWTWTYPNQTANVQSGVSCPGHVHFVALRRQNTRHGRGSQEAAADLRPPRWGRGRRTEAGAKRQRVQNGVAVVPAGKARRLRSGRCLLAPLPSRYGPR